MEKAIIGKKVGMTQIFDADGKVIPVTVIEAGPCTVIQKKTVEKEGYNSVQLGFESVEARKLNKRRRATCRRRGTPSSNISRNSAWITSTPTTSATCSRPMCSPRATASTSPA